MARPKNLPLDKLIGEIRVTIDSPVYAYVSGQWPI